MWKFKETLKNYFNDNFYIFLLCVLAGLFGCLCWIIYTDYRTANDYQHVYNSVEHVEAGIEDAESGVGTAQTEIKHAEKHIQRANEATGKLTERTKRNAEELDECQRITDRMQERASKIEGIVESVEAGNPGTRTQTDSHT